MKIFKKESFPNGRRHIYLCGIRVAVYKKHAKSIFLKGSNNSVVNPQSTCKVYIYGTNNKIVFGNVNSWIGNIFIGLPDVPVNNCSVFIGDNATSNGTDIRICEDNTSVEIGKDCMFSSEVKIWASDTHTIINLNTKTINSGRYVKIGEHVWIGFSATVLKNTQIADNCVIGTYGVVSGTFKQMNCVIAGNPGKIVKENVSWDRRRPKQYIMENTNENN